MIRDPSDGSVKPPKPATSGLPEIKKEKSDELIRLEKSRAWLKDYHQATREQPDIDDIKP